jgi:hypothetical protein
MSPRKRLSKKEILKSALDSVPDFQGHYPTGPTRWLRVPQTPFSRGLTYHLISIGELFSVAYKVPGSSRIIRLIDGESLDRYLIKLGKQQAAEAKGKPRPARTIGIKKSEKKSAEVPSP